MSHMTLFEGCATALVTPFSGGEIDQNAYIRLVRRQLEGGVDALVVAGTTGEASTLTDRERAWLMTATIREVRAAGKAGTVPVIAGTGSNNTARAIELSRLAADCGCDGLLVVTPYYNKASEDGLVAHYTAVADAAPLPMIAYHVPSRTGCRLTPAQCVALSAHPRIVGLKDASGDLSFTARVRAACGDRLAVYAGNDDQLLPILSLGGRGVISVVSNLCPARMTRLCRLWREGRVAEAADEQLRLVPICEALFADVNPIPVKYALSRMGLCPDDMRLPLAPASGQVRGAVDRAMADCRSDGRGNSRGDGAEFEGLY